ncbi:MAG: toll/interleukin-1 receptor domain-containing protein [Hyphomonas sp.]|uniref:toll/interleukin-1 receptor domain-containing protein n=1 Tax=Hyphomonas sp. TaxID=87 RepID=UPI0025BE6910|nr:toll/interleukin-1 receptor domain-containing protein [Hyphomonas sp.]MBA4338884.1 toll/interleukin-1 receptor domain-containing protein [Hyphomonas sp.]
MTPEPAAFLDLINRALAIGAMDDALRVLRDLCPPTARSEEMRGLRKQLILLRARGRDIQEAERIGTLAAAAAEAETTRLRSLAAHLARDVVSACPPAGLSGLGVALSAVIAGREPKPPPGAQPVQQMFLSYRRADSADVSGRIRERLLDRFGPGSVFMDVDSIPLGVDFRAHIVSTLARCRTCLVIIGPQWSDARDAKGQRRLDDHRDTVRVEIEIALKVGARVIPLLVGNARMPEAEHLPEDVRDLAYRNAMPVRPDPDFGTDTERLIARLGEQIA